MGILIERTTNDGDAMINHMYQSSRFLLFFSFFPPTPASKVSLEHTRDIHSKDRSVSCVLLAGTFYRHKYHAKY